MSTPLGDEINRLTAIKDVLLAALIKIACYHDRAADAYLAKTGSYGMFDNPGVVRLAREALQEVSRL